MGARRSFARERCQPAPTARMPAGRATAQNEQKFLLLFSKKKT